ncbi:MAG: DUF2085 domain-containing protein [Candidatus Micrarchaeota archaeon]
MRFGYKLYMALLAAFTLPILLTPFLAAQGNPAAPALYGFYGLSCHQYVSRSICYFPEAGLGDCTSGPGLAPYRLYSVEKDGLAGYPFPVCARDVGIYSAALLGGALLFFLRKTDGDVVLHPIWFALALVPIALDGGTQLIGLRESTNSLRLLTGAIAGFAFPFFCVPLLNRAFPDKK